MLIEHRILLMDLSLIWSYFLEELKSVELIMKMVPFFQMALDLLKRFQVLELDNTHRLVYQHHSKPNNRHMSIC